MVINRLGALAEYMMYGFDRKKALLLTVLLALTACGGGGSDSGGGGNVNTPPTANAGADQSVDEQLNITLTGSGSTDSNGDTLTYFWTQTGGENVTVNSASSSQANFEAPNVGIGSSVTLTFELRVNDGRASDTDSVDVVVNGVSNSDPTVNAGSDQTVAELTTVNLTGSAEDGDLGDTLSFTWTQMNGPAVTIAAGNSSNASFTAPDVAAAGEVLTFQLAVNDGTATITDLIDVTVNEALPAVTVSGRVFYEFVPPVISGTSRCSGLDFGATQPRPVRAATVQLLDAGSGALLDTTVSTDNGEYSFNDIAASLEVRLRVRAELKRSGSPSWDVEVRDNVDTSPNPPPLGSRPLYVFDSPNFNTGSADLVRDVTATTGWGGSSYTGTRAAAPFAILDAIYSGMQLVLTADANAIFGPMDAFWSVNNTLTAPSDIDAGELSSSFYRGDLDSLFLLGDANVDTEEFDDHVSVHEWGHYFEDVFSRSDSIGGPHSIGESIDARLAFGEGWATALAAMALNDPQYCDSSIPGTSGGFGLNTETNNSGPQGWYNEMSVATLLYDLWDTDIDGSDNGSIGFGPIFDTMTGPQNTTEAFTTLFSFAAGLRSMLNASNRAFLDSQLSRENIESSNIDIWASSQGSINVAPNTARDVLPLYTTLPTNGNPINICTNSDYDDGRDGNKLSESRYLTFTTTSTASYRVVITTTTATPPTTDTQPVPPVDIRDQSDPDMYLYRGSQLITQGVSGTDNSEIFNTPSLSPGRYIADLQEWRYADERVDGGDGASSDFPEQICFDVSMTPL